MMSLFVRWFGGSILCFFAFIPAWILYHAIADVIGNPKEIDLTWVMAVIVCSSLLYFLLLLAYRAFTGRGRKQDGGLLPPLALQIFGALFGALAVIAIGFGIYEDKPRMVVGGIVYMCGVSKLSRVLKARKN